MNFTQTLEAQSLILRRRYFPGINWGAIFAGLVVGVAIQLILALLGLAAGLSQLDTAGGGGNAATMWPPMWALLGQATGMLVAAFIGGYVAARMSGLQRKTEGMLHGLVAWGMSTLLIAFFATTALGMVLNGTLPSLNMTGFQTEVSVSQVDGNAQLEAMMRRESSLTGQSVNVAPQALAELGRHIQNGDREAAIGVLTRSFDLAEDRARALADEALVNDQSAKNALGSGQRAQETITNAKATSWWIFGVALLALLLGLAGGLLGALGAQRSRGAAEALATPL